MGNQKSIKVLIGVAVLLLIFAAVLLFTVITSAPLGPANANVNEATTTPVTVEPIETKALTLVKFTSADDFKNYLKSVSELITSAGGGIGRQALAPAVPSTAVMEKDLSLGTYAGLGTAEAGVSNASPERVSETNVQVAGIDEPDILKTDGKQIFYSQAQRYYYAPRPMILEQGGTVKTKVAPNTVPPPEMTAKTQIIKAFPPAELAKIGGIDKVGNLLLSGNILLILTNDNHIYGYDVAEPSAPKEKWAIKLEDNNYLVQSRLFNGLLYLVTSQGFSEYDPCPIKIMTLGETETSVACNEIYHPVVPLGVDVTYTALALDPATGQVSKKVSFVGASDAAVIYMSKNALYTTYSYYPDVIKFIYNFFLEKAGDLVPEAITARLKKLVEYDISNAAKMTEFQLIMENFDRTLSGDNRLKLENELSNRMKDYLSVHLRELEKSAVVKIGLDNFEVSAIGDVPGQPLNQFSLDEYENNLRIAVTISGGTLNLGSSESVSDVYVLDSALKIMSSVNDLGKGERIYSARFIDALGYVVTFRQTDPFYVLDLADPKNAQLKGELKIPGFSSYLHPISKTKVLGIGREQSKVKISLFDVADPANPAEAAKYLLDEYWSEVQNTHHAFLLDVKHEVFFLPGSKGGYIFSYKNNELKLEKAVSDIQAKRAMYLDDYMYIIGDDKVVVINENDWQRVKEIDL